MQLARRRLQQTLDTQLEGGSRVTHAAALLADDPHDAREHDAERELDFARTDQIEAQLRGSTPPAAPAAAGLWPLPGLRLRHPFDRLTHQPQALRCVECQTEFEAAQAD